MAYSVNFLKGETDMDKEKLAALVKDIETLELTDDERKKAQGSFIQLPCGNTHYEMKGEGKACVLVHGYATPYFIYDKVFDRLVAEGYKVIRYDLLGRGLSERVKTDYTPELFARQLKELTEALLGDEKFILFGTSMGGSITTAFCKLFPGKTEQLVLLAPAGMDTFKPPFYMYLTSAPLLGDILFSIIGGKTLLKKCAGELIYSGGDVEEYYMKSFAYTIKYKGFHQCTLSSLRNTILNTKETVKGYYSVAEQKIPMLVIWGTADRTMPYYQIDRMKEICPDAKYETFDGSGHIFLFDEGDHTMNIVMPFIKKNEV